MPRIRPCQTKQQLAGLVPGHVKVIWKHPPSWLDPDIRQRRAAGCSRPDRGPRRRCGARPRRRRRADAAGHRRRTRRSGRLPGPLPLAAGRSIGPARGSCPGRQPGGRPAGPGGRHGRLLAGPVTGQARWASMRPGPARRPRPAPAPRRRRSPGGTGAGNRAPPETRSAVPSATAESAGKPGNDPAPPAGSWGCPSGLLIDQGEALPAGGWPGRAQVDEDEQVGAQATRASPRSRSATRAGAVWRAGAASARPQGLRPGCRR